MPHRLTSLGSKIFFLRRRTPALIDRHVRVFLNQSRVAFAGYQPGAPLALVYTLTLDTVLTASDPQTLDRVFAMFNGHPLHDKDAEHTRTWYDSRLRSISVGDVVALDDRSYACAAVGWQLLEPR